MIPPAGLQRIRQFLLANRDRILRVLPVVGVIVCALIFGVTAISLLQNARQPGPSPTATVVAVVSPPMPVPTIPATSSPVSVKPTETPLPSPTPAGQVQTYTVQAGDTLSGIAQRFDVPAETIQQANQMGDPDRLAIGDVLIIPIGAMPTVTPGAVVEPSPPFSPTVAVTPFLQNGAYRFSILDGNLDSAYPLTRSGDGFTLHYQSGSYAAQHIDEIATFVPQARDHITRVLGVRFLQPVDIYLAGSLFAPPDQALRGRSFSALRRILVLFDGSGTLAEQHYMLAHELTHLIAWNTYGQPASSMLSEGLAVHAAEDYLYTEPYLTIRQFCLAYRRAGRLPSISSPSLQLQGHLLNLDAYNASGCFVQYLISTYSPASLGQLYSSLRYNAIYGKGLSALEQAWLKELDADTTQLAFAPAQLPVAYARLVEDYRTFFNTVIAARFDTQTYQTLDQRRVAILQGRLQP